MDVPFFIYTAIVVFLLAVIGLSERRSNKRLEIMKWQDKRLANQREDAEIYHEQVKKRDEIINEQRKLIEEKMMKEAFEKPKKQRGRPRKSV